MGKTVSQLNPIYSCNYIQLYNPYYYVHSYVAIIHVPGITVIS